MSRAFLRKPRRCSKRSVKNVDRRIEPPERRGTRLGGARPRSLLVLQVAEYRGGPTANFEDVFCRSGVEGCLLREVSQVEVGADGVVGVAWIALAVDHPTGRRRPSWAHAGRGLATMVAPVLVRRKAEEFKRLYAEYVTASAKAHAALMATGMASHEFADADAAVGQLWRRLRELQGMGGKPWMA
jgi:hypothetical protein